MRKHPQLVVVFFALLQVRVHTFSTHASIRTSIDKPVSCGSRRCRLKQTRIEAFPLESLGDFAHHFLAGTATLQHLTAPEISVDSLPPFDDLMETVKNTVAEVAQPAHEAAVVEGVGKDALESMGNDILVFLAATVAVVPFSKYFRIPSVLAFIATGYLLGPYCLDAFANKEAAFELGDIGILFLLFSEGLNLSPERLKRLGAFGPLGVAQIMLSMAIFFFGLLLLEPIILKDVGPMLHMDGFIEQIFESPTLAFCIASAGALSSSAFVLPVLDEKGWKEKPEGIAAFSVLLLQDLAVAPLLVLLPLVAGSGPQSSAELGVLVAKATVGFGAVLYLGSVVLRYVFDAVAAARSTETFVAAALLVALGMGQAADMLGLSGTTGAFAAGVILANNRYRAQIKADVRPFEGILLGIFFMTAGASIDPAVVLADLPTLMLGISLFIAAKASVLYFAALPLGKSKAQAARVAITLSGGGEFSLVLFNVARDLGVMPIELYKFLVATVIISMALTPLLGEVADKAGHYLDKFGQDYAEPGYKLATEDAINLFSKIDKDNSGTIEFEELREALLERNFSFAEIADVFVAFDTDGNGNISEDEWLDGIENGLLTDAMELSDGEKTSKSAKIAPDAFVVCGYTEFGKKMYQVLNEAGAAENGGVVAFDLNPSRVAAGLLLGDNVVYGDAASPELLQAAGVRSPRGVIVAFRSEAKRLDATERLRAGLPPGTPIYARVVSGQVVGRDELIQAGATEVVNERVEASLRFAVLMGVIQEDRVNMLRPLVFPTTESSETTDGEPNLPGVPESRLRDLAEEFGCSKTDLVSLHRVFTSLPEVDGDQFIPVDELRDAMLRLSRDGPLNDEELEKWMQFADYDYSGKISFVDFVRVYYKSMNVPTRQ